MKAGLKFEVNPKRQRPMPVPAPVRNPISLTLLWASKTDARLVSVCSSWAMATQTAFGLFVFFTAVLAFGAAFCTFSTLHASPTLVPVIALGWSLFIFFLDREIVGGLDKLTVMVRPLLALFIGTTIAIPVQLWIFQGRIDQELQRQYRSDNRQQLESLAASRHELVQRRAGLESSVADLRTQETDWGRVMDDELVGRSKDGRTGIRGAGSVFQNAQAQQAAVRQRIEEIQDEVKQLDMAMPREHNRLDREFQSEVIAFIADFVTRYEAMDKVIHSSDSLYRLSWLITLTLILIEMMPALLKALTPHVDYHHLVSAEIRENIARIDEISDRNYWLAMENPEVPELSVSEKFAKVRYGPVPPNGFRREQ